jgi:outer membrane protein assembly factor BamB
MTVVSENKLGSEVFATPSFAGNRIYLRVAEIIDGKRQEFLYCVGAKK